MHFTDLFIRRPVFASVLSLVILLVGVISYLKLPVRQFPKIDTTVITVSTAYPGASPSLMEGFVTTPIEGAIAGIDGLDYLTSSNSESSSRISANFKLGYDINAAIADVMNSVSSVRWQLPKNVNDPSIRKMDPNATPVLYISFASSTMNVEQINDYLVRVVQPVLETIPGVGQARIFGNLTYAMRIWLNPYQMAARGVTASDVTSAMTNNNLQAPTGRIKNKWQEFNTNIKSDIETAAQFNNLVIKKENGSLIRVNDVGFAELGAPEQQVQAFRDGIRTNVMGIVPKTDANPLEVSDLVKAEIEKMKPTLPPGLNVKVVWDNGKFIQASISEVKRTIIEAAIFVVLIIFLFLGSIRAVLIPTVTIPLCLIGACGLMMAMGFSLNTMTFLAFVLAVGMVVDDAIVVSENIHRNIEKGMDRFNASLVGTREISFAVIAMTLTLVAVYAPILFLSGLTGALFKEFAITLAGAVVISGFVALTLSPMLCSKILPERGQEASLERYANAFTSWLANVYKTALQRVLNVRLIVFLVIIGVFALCAMLYKSIPSELAPKEDIGAVITMATAPAAANLQFTGRFTKEIDKVYQSVPEGAARLVINGIPDGVNTALTIFALVDWSQRKRSLDQIIASLFPKMQAIPGILAFPINPYRLPGSTGLFDIGLVLKTTESYATLNKIAQQIKADAAQSSALANINVNLKIDKPQIDVTVNRNLAGDLGVSVSDIANALNIALGEPEFNQFEMNGRAYYVIPKLKYAYRNTPQAMDNLYVRSTRGNLIPLSTFINIGESVQPQSLNHFQQLRSATFTGSPAPGYTLSEGLAELKKIAGKYIGGGKIQIDYSGQSRQFIKASGAMTQTFIFAILFIFLVLSAQFESFRDPLIVMISVPLSTAGGLLFLKLGGGTMNIYTEIALVTLIGLISKHGILMVEFANQLQGQGKSKFEAIVDAASIRLRPILMTTFAMILGALPLALSSGAGAISRHQIGLVIIGGMAFGTLFTLFIVPTVYTWLASNKH